MADGSEDTAWSYGIGISGTKGSIVSGNHITSDSPEDYLNSSHIDMYFAEGAVIKHNKLSGLARYGIYVEWGSTNNLFFANDFEDLNFYRRDILLLWCDYNHIFGIGWLLNLSIGEGECPNGCPNQYCCPEHNCLVGEWRGNELNPVEFPPDLYHLFPSQCNCIDYGIAPVVDPNAIVDKSVTLGTGVVIEAYANVNKNSVIGNNVRIEESVFVNKETTIGSCSIIDVGTVFKEFSTLGGFSFVGRDSIVDKGCEIGDRVLIRSNNIIKKRVRIGDSAVIGLSCLIMEETEIGAGVLIGNNVQIGNNSKILKDVPDGTIIPAGTIWQ